MISSQEKELKDLLFLEKEHDRESVLEKNDYKHISSKSLYKDQLTFDKILRSDSKVVISIDGSELVKGRGGPRCMTLPINRGLL